MVDPPEAGTWGVMRGAREMGQMGRAGEETCFFRGRGGSRRVEAGRGWPRRCRCLVETGVTCTRACRMSPKRRVLIACLLAMVTMCVYY